MDVNINWFILLKINNNNSKLIISNFMLYDFIYIMKS